MVDSPAYRSDVAAYQDSQRDPDRVSANQLRLVLAFSREVAAHGAVPIMLRPPELVTWRADIVARIDHDCAGKLPLRFDLSSPRQYPDLWDPKNRFNSDHLNADGAAIFSRLIAEQLRAAIDDHSISLPLCTAAE
jgi:hypothetical protein